MELHRRLFFIDRVQSSMRISLWATGIEREQKCGDIKEVPVAVACKVSRRILCIKGREEDGDIKEVHYAVFNEVRWAIIRIEWSVLHIVDRRLPLER